MACESSGSTAALAGQQPPPSKRGNGALPLHWALLTLVYVGLNGLCTSTIPHHSFQLFQSERDSSDI